MSKVALWFKLEPRKRRGKKQNKELPKILGDLLLAFLFGVIPMPVAFRWSGWLLCWAIFLWLLNSANPISRIPKRTRVVVSLLLLALFCVAFNSTALSMWKEEKSEVFHGTLSVKRRWFAKKEYRPDSDVKFAIGPGGTIVSWTGTLPTADLSPPRSRLQIRRIGGDLFLTADVRDKNNALIVRIIDNIWTVVRDNSFDHNYSGDSLEVKDKTGRVVLKTVLFDDHVQIEGEWWNEDGLGWRMLRPYPYDPVKTGPVFVKLVPSQDWDEPSIREMFKYPSYKHFDELTDSQSNWLTNVFVFQVFGLDWGGHGLLAGQ